MTHPDRPTLYGCLTAALAVTVLFIAVCAFIAFDLGLLK